jgi:pyridoxal phosphate enzyme (YggS family)
VRRALAEARRPAGSVRVMAVTKGHGRERVDKLKQLGFTLFGENRVQEAQSKFEDPAGQGINLHLIGHLQTNKVKSALEIFQVIQSLDSIRLAAAIQARAQGRTVSVMVEVNAGREPQKYGVWPESVPAFIDGLREFSAIHVVGLMAVMPFVSETRPYMEETARVWRKERTVQRPWAPLDDLSMGSSNDFEEAILQGSTMIRLGTVLVGARSGYPGQEGQDEGQSG